MSGRRLPPRRSRPGAGWRPRSRRWGPAHPPATIDPRSILTLPYVFDRRVRGKTARRHGPKVAAPFQTARAAGDRRTFEASSSWPGSCSSACSACGPGERMRSGVGPWRRWPGRTGSSSPTIRSTPLGSRSAVPRGRRAHGPERDVKPSGGRRNPPAPSTTRTEGRRGAGRAWGGLGLALNGGATGKRDHAHRHFTCSLTEVEAAWPHSSCSPRGCRGAWTGVPGAGPRNRVGGPPPLSPHRLDYFEVEPAVREARAPAVS